MVRQKPNGATGSGVGLIVVGAVNFLTSGIYLIGGLSNIGGGELDKSVSSGDTAGTVGYVIGSVFPILCLILAPATIIGGVQLIRGRTRNLAVVGAIVALVPLTSCCFLAGIPLGIWALVVLRRPDVRAWFAGRPGADQQTYQPYLGQQQAGYQQYPPAGGQQPYPPAGSGQQPYPPAGGNQQYPQDPYQPWG